MYEKVKRFMILYVLIVLCFAFLNNINSTGKKESVYKSEIIKEIDLKENVKEINIITTENMGENEELVVYSYYSNLNNRYEVGLKYAIWNNSDVELTDLSVPQKNIDLPVTFSNIIRKPDGNASLVGNKYSTEYYMISYGAVFDDKIENIKLLYCDGSAIIRPVIKNGYVIFRINNISGVTSIEALDKDENVIYKEIIWKQKMHIQDVLSR